MKILHILIVVVFSLQLAYAESGFQEITIMPNGKNDCSIGSKPFITRTLDVSNSVFDDELSCKVKVSTKDYKLCMLSGIGNMRGVAECKVNYDLVRNNFFLAYEGSILINSNAMCSFLCAK